MNNFLNRLERSLGWLAIGNLPVYVVTAQAILYVWTLVNPGNEHLLVMQPDLVLHGEVWRLLTFLFLIPFQSILWAFFYLYFQYVCGVTLEQEWGSFRFTLFYLVGALGCIAGAFIAGQDLTSAFYLNETVFLAFAALYPDYEILLFLILPIRIKWLAWLTWAQILFGFVMSPWLFRLAILVSLSNYFLFFSESHYQSLSAAWQRRQNRRRHKDLFS
ncbi:MAG: rhomboid family intramembrane serine protease [Elusimicrobia bacterium]|nr:rhomboid family intramembrane serine protease [Elusimicrobiota bacterium]